MCQNTHRHTQREWERASNVRDEQQVATTHCLGLPKIPLKREERFLGGDGEGAIGGRDGLGEGVLFNNKYCFRKKRAKNVERGGGDHNDREYK